jgi:uncharacterized membrane protein
MKLPLYQVDAFTQRLFGGNPAAVVLLDAWLVIGLGLLPLSGRGVFAHGLGLGGLPAALMLVMLMLYSIVMSLLYAWLSRSPRNEG